MGANEPIRTLLVEDDVPIRVLLRKALQDSGQFDVIGEAGDGVAAIDQAKRLQPELIMLDLMMPIMNGFQALPLLRQEVPSARVVVLSMLQGNPIQRECMDLGAALFLDKMVKDEEMIRQILAVVAGEARQQTVSAGSF